MTIPSCITAFIQFFAGTLDSRTLTHLSHFAMARIVAGGITTITQLSQIFGYDPYRSPWHRVFGRHRIDCWKLCFRLIEIIILKFQLSSLLIAIDDTTCLHKGKKVYGRAKHRDSVRSSHALNIPLFGHKWVVLTIVVRIPGSLRQWALPVAVGLCRSSDYAKTHRCLHKTPAHIARLLLAKIRRRFPEIPIIVVGDQGYGQHETSCFTKKLRMSHVSKFYPDAALHGELDLRLPRWGKKLGRPRLKGPKILTPQQTVVRSHLTVTQVTWYGGKSRKVGLVSGTGFWFRRASPLIQVKWVFVRDLTGTHRDEYFYTNDLSLSPEEIVSIYTARWAIETTFQECKGLIKVDKTRVWQRQSTLTLIPILFGLYSAIVLIGSEKMSRISGNYPGKSSITFSDYLRDARREIWIIQPFMHNLTGARPTEKSRKDRETLVNLLTRAA